MHDDCAWVKETESSLRLHASCAGGRAAALLALEEGRVVVPANDSGQPAAAVRATNYTLWRQDGAAYEVDWEEVGLCGFTTL